MPQYPSASAAPTIVGFMADVSGLTGGSAYQVRVRPIGPLASPVLSNTLAGNTSWYNWQWGSSVAPANSWPADAVFTTTCSCNTYNPTGAPLNLNVTQVYDHMMFT